jgi:L-arabinose transport system substrate-binding protein
MKPLPRPLSRRQVLAALAVLPIVLSGCSRQADAGAAGTPRGPIKIGFMVKQPEEPWFQLEWKFAEQAARDLGFTLIKIGATDGEKVLAGIDNLAAAGAQGLIICTPDTRLGPAIVNKAKAANLKLIAVDDQFIGANGQPMTNVHYLGISAAKIGETVGNILAEQMKKRGWSPAETAVCAVTYDQLATAKERTDAAIQALIAAGFPRDRIFRAPERTPDIPGALDATNVLLTQQPHVKQWLVCSMNDNGVLGAVRALEGRGFGPENAIGVGINGTDCITELERERPTAFYGSILLSAKEHGYKTCEMMYRWIKDGVEPPLDTRTVGTFITRENFRQVLKEQGITE